jgi:hypothetical protein
MSRFEEKTMRGLAIIVGVLIACSAAAQTPRKGKPVPPAAAAKAPEPAAEPAPKDWDKEPDAFLGIHFGEPFKVEPCPIKVLGQYVKTEILDYDAVKSLPGVCVDPTDASYKYGKPENTTYKLANLPALGIGYKVSVQMKDAVVSKITMELDQSNFGVLLQAFKDRYGAPTEVKTDTVKNRAGGEFSATDVTWRGKKLSISMYERLNRIDESYVVISDNVIMAQEIAAQRAKRASEAQKF